MKTHYPLAYLVSILLISTAFSQSAKFRSGIFLHHSTGACIWGPNGSTTSVPLEISAYNLQRGLTGQNAVSLGEFWWPVTQDNEWETWHQIFENRDTQEDIRPILDTARIVIIKSCFPSSQITGYGTAADTLAPTLKTIWNYKWQWRGILKVMRQRPTIFFVIWTNAPLVAAATNDQQAILSDQFCRWAKDTLARGLDSQFGRFPANVYVFDFFHKLAGADGKLPLKYAGTSSDSHPNNLATQLVAPQFVSEVFNAALSYETVVSVQVSVRVFLGGPFSGGAMTTTLNTSGLIPLTSDSAYSAATYGYTASTVASIPSASIVDWVLVELRSDTTAPTKAATRAGFLKSDGTVVDIDGASPLSFTGISPGNYFVVVRHRNHLAIMSAAAVALSSTSALYDFTTAQAQAYGTSPMAALTGGVFGMIAGDVNQDGIVEYNLASNDRGLIYLRIGSGNVNATVSGYYPEDINLDGIVKYNLDNNDRGIIYVNIGGGSVNGTVSTKVPK